MSEKEVLIEIEEEPIPLDVKHAYIRQMESLSTTILINTKLVVVLDLACVCILFMVVCISKTLLLEKKIVLCTIVGVVLISINVVLCISKKMPSTLIIFSTIGAFISGLCLGLSMWYM
jgi:hypothetical protein